MESCISTVARWVLPKREKLSKSLSQVKWKLSESRVLFIDSILSDLGTLKPAKIDFGFHHESQQN